jgi:hypothetical protein
MVVLISPASMASKEVRREIEHAFLAKNFAHRVLPVYVKPTLDVPWFLGSLKGVRIGGGRAKAIQQIKDALDQFEERQKRYQRKSAIGCAGLTPVDFYESRARPCLVSGGLRCADPHFPCGAPAARCPAPAQPTSARLHIILTRLAKPSELPCC